jgi:2-alkenal reductase
MFVRRGLVIALILLVVSGTALATPMFQDDDPVSPLTQIYNDVSPSVVAISVTATPEDGSEGNIFKSGTGFVIDTDGHIVTNFHVVDRATNIEIRFIDGTQAKAEIIGLDDDSDLAVLQVELDEAKLHPVEFGDSDALVVGQEVLALGSPFGQNWTLTRGIVSALNRTISGFADFSIGGVIQTDAAINPGNSGGPLLNMDGQVIGVNAQIQTTIGANLGVGFAIPSNLTRRVAEELIESGYIQYSYLGISGGDVSLTTIDALDLPNDLQGVAVSDVMAGGPAARAGINTAEFSEVNGQQIPRAIDIITAIDGEPVSGIASLISLLAQNTEPGQTVTLSILRDGEDEIEIDVLLTPRP